MLQRLDLRGCSGDLTRRLPRPVLDPGPLEEVRAVIAAVRAGGDATILDLTRRFDGVELDAIAVPKEVLAAAPSRIPAALVDALESAHEAITDFHRHRPAPVGIFRRAGVSVRHLELPVGRAGLYAPGGRARYPSSVLMTAVPARVAGVGSIACCVPPGPDGEVPVEMLAAAAIAGVDEVYRVGGAQAIAALAYGTESIPKVDVIAGPGSRRVSLAQREVRGDVGVPGAFAGPSEVVVVADDTTPVAYAAIDLVVQAEHGPDGLAWLITWSEPIATAVEAEVARLVVASPRRAEIESTLRSGGYSVVVDGPEEALAVANAIAPEHLELLVDDPEPLLGLVRNAGAVFCGPLAPAAVGDYVAGPSHVLPTFGSARFASVLGVEDFVRRVHAISVEPSALASLAETVTTLANAEGLPAHGEAVRLRAEREGAR